MKPSVLVTGAGGFIGSHLARTLARQGQRVRGVDVDLRRFDEGQRFGALELVEGDITDPEVQRHAVSGVEVVYHLAAAHLSVRAAKQEYHRVNVEAVRGLAAAAAETGVRRFVHCSSVGVYGRIESPPANEETPCRPELVYERTKLEGEEMVLDAIRNQKLPAVILRPVWVYGPGCRRTERLFLAIGSGRFVMAGRGRRLRHCVYVRDMVEALQLAARAEAAVGRILVVGDRSAVTVRRLLSEIAAVQGRRPPPAVSLPLFYVLAAAVEVAFRLLGREPPASRRTVRFFTANTAFDVSRARELLGFEARYDLRAGLAETYRQLGGNPVSRDDGSRAAGTRG